MTRDIFERYLQHRFAQSGAVTPGQQLDVLRTVRAEAMRGMVPVDENSLVSVDLESPAVQAVLRGEPVSIGNGSVLKKGNSMNNLSDAAKLGILAAIFFIPLLLSVGYVLMQDGAGRDKRGLSAAPTPTATPIIARPTRDLSQAPLTPTVTPVPPQALSQSATDLVYMPNGNDAGQEPVAPASVEIGNRHFVVHIGEVARDTGVWQPKGGVEWLPTTQVRKVLAVPRDQLDGLAVQVGDPVVLRYRNGYTITYTLTQILPGVVADQIEVLASLRPSLALVAYTNNLRDPKRLVLLAELSLPVSYAPEVYVSQSRAQIAIDNVGLYQSPAFSSAVLAALARAQVVQIQTQVPAVYSEGYNWLYVCTPSGCGWVLSDFLISQGE